ncbi:Outer membrane protein containing ImpK/VasF, OmpA/MotB domain [Paraburkholderia caribensis MBA4]|uniref:Outer membrane protein containing ImpK/VasF, OmpA/MotB domain n=1 Tax=Paraburkholderia caribensis MBA4 TaxID=1323664 RepID=A0A0P0REE4_9BURK|nr:DotU family type VI secretion system protein [Paraburkholderia caribensis]ALL66860.1 Outer membrane protein containing ImpK/VasF, OmpA/MotB domain [Paraburkholderia caribensis MBA4]
MTPDEPRGPLEDPGATILIPTPGGARAAFVAAAASAAPIPPLTGGLNPLLRAANPLLELAVPLRQLPTHPNVEELRTQLIQMMRTFETQGRASGIDDEKLGASRYCLCTFLDEAISSTPWGAGMWASRSLLVTFHNEASGGERFFLILQRLAQNPTGNVDVLELIYVILGLGFEGRYRLIDGGRTQLDTIRERLETMIRSQRGAAERDLSVHWLPVKAERKALLQLVPLWVAAAIACVVLVAVHLVLSLRLNDESDRVFAALHGVRVAPQPLAAKAAPPPPALAPKLSQFLAPEIAQGLVRVSELPDRTVVEIKGDGLFASGSAELESAYMPLIQRIGDALKDVPGNVVVAGHTDNQRLLSARFPSNWHLSQARADVVKDMLAARTGSPGRFVAEGRGDTEPIAPNDSPANRAKNRRVDITILAPGAAS